ncbi:hypothetical protein [Nocardioides coralli]|uniref:hypothetical protein n=1 Tax=Nocardioides coralli TaxID=2872154 RepID=UPI001CA3919E|nr:hypothetical protein [Nocardioides coralli]QZY28640.1 hypothetical protein K6T13_14410 [Nocardioides coralli]
MTGLEAMVSLALLVVLTATATLHDVRRRRRAPVPAGRPIEAIAADVRRISARFHVEGTRFAKYEGYRRSYDQVLAEAADTLEIDHLMRVLPPGLSLDRERERLEDHMIEAGLLPRL